MAYFPCDRGPHFNPGRNVNLYLGLVGNGPDRRLTGRLCELHWREVESHLAEYEVVPDDIAGSISLAPIPCATCKQPVHQGGARAFLTSYPAKNDRKDYWLNVHDPCGFPDWLYQLESKLR